jgi:hypothetical protein
VVLTWIKPNGEPRPGIPVINEALVFFVDKMTLQRFLRRQASAAEFIQRATISGFDGRTELGRLNLEVSDPGPARAPLRDGQPAC